MPVSMTDLASGERIGLAAIEVTSVPHLSILQKRFSADADIDAEYKQDMARLLSEVFQCHKNAPCACQDISIEILWTTQEAKGQPYRASIKLHIVIRAIGDSDADADIGSAIETLAGTFKATLDFGKYEYRDIPYGELASRVRKIDGRSVRAVVKSERLEALQSAVMPHCFSFERMPATENDLSRLVGSLIDHPDCAVSLQLMPTAYSASEAAAVGASAQTLGTLARGIMEHGVGHVGFALAERHAETYKYYSRGKDTALFAFNILVIGAPGAADAVATRILAQLNSGSELRIVPLSPDDVRKDDNFFPLPWAAREAILATDRSPAIWGAGQSLGAFYNLPYIITAEEASEFFRLPVGSDAVHAGLSVNESGKASRTYADNLVGGGDVAVGALKSSHRGDAVGISLKDLAKHMLVVGTPGSGKTTFSVGLLDRLWKDHRIPFLVIEPAKSEYRALVRSIPDLQVFTPGKNFISPFIFNPFLPPKNVRLETYKSTLKTAFAAAVSMSSPLDKIFEEAVNNCYSDFRWLDTYTSDDKGRVFNIADFIKCFGETFDAIGYTGDARNIGRAGLVRLQSLANLFDNYSSIPIEDLLTRPTVIELAAIENGDQKALIVSLLLLSVLAYVNGNYLGEGGLRNVILLEEAHVLLDAAGRPGEGEADPSAIAQGLLKRMLAEIRSYGVGVVIADQSPRKVTADVIALTDIKLAFRLVEATDRQILADSSNMSEAQKQRLSRLRPGEAFLFFGRLDEPEEIRTEDYRQVNGIGITLSDEAIGALSMYWKGRADMLRPYPECSHCRGCAGGCDYGRRTLGREVARRIFVKNFGPASSDPGQVRTVFRQMEPLIRQELNDEPFDRALFACAELHLMRRIRYGTRIGISDATVETTLSNI